MRVDRYTKECERRSGVGMIEQSLCHHLHTQLTEYYKLIAVLESQMSMGIDYGQHHENPTSDNSNPTRREEIGLTLRRLDVWIDEWRLRMRMMSVCVEGARGNSVSRIDVLVDDFFVCRRTWWRPRQSHSRIY
jgi:gamma-tubulin complex component 3